ALGSRQLRLRIGIHSGPATAGVISDTRFSYDVWGDGVNTASRMESNGKPDYIQVSEAFHNLVADRFVFEERGVAEFKGIGAARTFFLIREVPIYEANTAACTKASADEEKPGAKAPG